MVLVAFFIQSIYLKKKEQENFLFFYEAIKIRVINHADI